jgi:hypothetical protein
MTVVYRINSSQYSATDLICIIIFLKHLIFYAHLQLKLPKMRLLASPYLIVSSRIADGFSLNLILGIFFPKFVDTLHPLSGAVVNTGHFAW